MAHDAIPLQSKSLGNKATEGHMPLIFAILLQNFVHVGIYINAISAQLTIRIMLQMMIMKNFAFFPHKLHKSNMLTLFRRRQ